MAFKIKVYDTDTKTEKWVTLDGEITANGELLLNKPLRLKSSQSSAIKEISVDDADSITGANAG